MQHLTAAMRVVRAHDHRTGTTIADTRNAVLMAAQHASDGNADAETQALIRKLEAATGSTIAELARLATTWLDA